MTFILVCTCGCPNNSTLFAIVLELCDFIAVAAVKQLEPRWISRAGKQERDELWEKASLCVSHEHSLPPHTKNLDLIKINWKLSVKQIIILGIGIKPVEYVQISCSKEKENKRNQFINGYLIITSENIALLPPLAPTWTEDGTILTYELLTKL